MSSFADLTLNFSGNARVCKASGHCMAFRSVRTYSITDQFQQKRREEIVGWEIKNLILLCWKFSPN